ncbi:hypothetical protein AMECASPLE_008728 [Ameca splendens]|uniref:Uncharacterized protein n=1 Tax=Ameca splendens TaxID=208324 RepID=A0ABV0Z8V1_9TELE
MEASSQSISQQVVWKDVEAEKQKKTRSHNYHWVALVLAVVFLVLAVCVFSLRYLWAPSLGKVRLRSINARHSLIAILSEVNVVFITDERHYEFPPLKIIQVSSKTKT